MNRESPLRASAQCLQVSRRNFLGKTVLAGTGLAISSGFQASAAPADGPLPMRILGRTRAKVTILGLGTAPIGEARIDKAEAEKIFGEMMDRGVNYIDTARNYGHAEEVLGQLVPSRRDKLFLVSKAWVDNPEAAEKSLAESLRTLKTDHLDLLHIHHVGGKDVDKVLAKDGLLDYMLKQKQAGKIRFIGISGHAGASRFLRVLETGQIDVMMTVLNYTDRNIYEFESKVLPACKKNNVGVVAMKVYAGIKGGFPNHRKGWVGCATPPERLQKAMAYALDLDGVCVANVGPFTLEQALQNFEYARAYKPLTEAERMELLAFGKELAPKLGPRYGAVS